MIDVAVTPDELELGVAGDLSISLTNRGDSVCSRIAFKLRLPATFVRLGGSQRLELARLGPGETATLDVKVRPTKVGRWEVSSPNFAYLDALGRHRRVQDLHRPVAVVPAVERPEEPAPVLRIKPHTSSLPLGEWDRLRGRVVHEEGIEIQRLKVWAEGPLESAGAWSLGSEVLPAGSSVEFALDLSVGECGHKVPLFLALKYVDRLGRSGRLRKHHPIRVEQRSRPEGGTGADDSAAGAVAGEGGPVTILLVLANPVATGPLQLAAEARDLQEKLRLAKKREMFRVETCLASRPGDLTQAIHDYSPRIIHFSGHGDEGGGLYFEDDAGGAKLVEPDALGSLFRIIGPQVDCVVLNACFSERQGTEIAKYVESVVGMSRAIRDDTARTFTVGFYKALGAGRSIQEAFEFGKAEIALEAREGRDVPLLFTSSGDRGSEQAIRQASG